MESPEGPRTIADLAAHLGVSSMTIHRAIADKPDISERTRARILAEIKRLGWQPNIAARSLRQGRTFTLGILVSNVSVSFLPEILLGVDRTAEEANCHTFVCVHEHDPGRAIQHLRSLQSKGVDGIILYPTLLGAEAEVVQQIRQATPVVLIMRSLPGIDCPAIVTDEVRCGELAAEHLLELGHRRMGYIGYRDTEISRARRDGYAQVLARAGHPLAADRILDALSSRALERDAILEYLSGRRRPTAVFCGSDRIAARTIQAAHRLGLRVPGDLSVLGSNGESWGELTSPPLTTIAQPRVQLGAYAARAVLCSDANPRLRAPRAPLPAHPVADTGLIPRLIPRASTAPPAGEAPGGVVVASGRPSQKEARKDERTTERTRPC